MRRLPLLVTTFLLLLSTNAWAQYNKSAGQSRPMAEREVVEVDEISGETVRRVVKEAPKKDGFGNAAGSNYDLAVDGAFEGQTVAVIQLYPFNFEDARAALKQKGFGVYRWSNGVPEPAELEKKLQKACQLWIISGSQRHLTEAHLKVIKKFFDSGKGLYIWGDNTPYHSDANYLASALFDSSMKGDYWGDKVVHMKVDAKAKSGLRPDHLLTTGLEHVFEGITIAAIRMTGGLKPLIWSSDGNIVTAFYDQGGKRAILDGGFTRLYNKWDTAGTGRYVKNAAAWLVNVERFGDDVVAAHE
jgi:hypothetical protein